MKTKVYILAACAKVAKQAADKAGINEYFFVDHCHRLRGLRGRSDNYKLYIHDTFYRHPNFYPISQQVLAQDLETEKLN